MRIGRKTKGLFFGLIVVLVFGLMLVGCGPKAAAPEEPLKIGYIMWNSGTGALIGQGGLIGGMWAVDEWNAKGGVLGKRIELIHRDSEAKPEQAARQAMELYYDLGCSFITGTYTSSETMSVSDWSKEHQVLFVSTIGASRILTDEMWHDHYFRCTINTVGRARGTAAGMADTGFTKYYFFSPDYEWGRRQCADFMVAIKKYIPDAEVVGEVWSPLGETEMTPYITKILAAEPEVIVSAHYGTDIAAFVRQAIPYGLLDKMVYANPLNADITNVIPLGWDFPEGQYGAMWYLPYYESPENDAWIAAYRKWSGKPDAFPDNRMYEGYVTHDFLFRAIEKAGSFDTDAIIEAGEGLKWETSMGEVEMRAYDHQIIGPMISGKTVKDPDWPDFVILGDMKYIPGEDACRTIDEVMADGHPGR